VQQFHSFYEALPTSVKPVLNINPDQLRGIAHMIREKLGSELEISMSVMGQMFSREYGYASNKLLIEGKYLDHINRYIADCSHTTTVVPSEPIPAEPLQLNWSTGSPDPTFVKCHINQGLSKLSTASDLWSDGVSSCQILDPSVPTISRYVNDVNAEFPGNVVSIFDDLAKKPEYPDCENMWNNLFSVTEDLESYTTWVNDASSLANIFEAAHEPLIKIGSSFSQIVEASELISLVLPFSS
jgi:hypothetical protein